MAEIKRAPVAIIVGGVEYEAFDEDHTLSDIARWIVSNRVDAEEMIRVLSEMTANPSKVEA